MKVLGIAVWLLLSAAAVQAADIALEVRDAADGGLRLHGVEVEQRGDTLVVSGRVQRAVALRSAAGRKVVVSVRAADGSARARREIGVRSLGLPRHGAAWSRFSISMPVTLLPGDGVSVSLSARGAS